MRRRTTVRQSAVVVVVTLFLLLWSPAPFSRGVRDGSCLRLSREPIRWLYRKPQRRSVLVQRPVVVVVAVRVVSLKGFAGRGTEVWRARRGDFQSTSTQLPPPPRLQRRHAQARHKCCPALLIHLFYTGSYISPQHTHSYHLYALPLPISNPQQNILASHQQNAHLRLHRDSGRACYCRLGRHQRVPLPCFAPHPRRRLL